MRCLTLARGLRDNGVECQFISRALPGHMESRIAEEGFGVTLLSAPSEDPPPSSGHASWAGVGWLQDASETRDVLSANPPDWLVLDHYAFDKRWEQAARLDGTKLMIIDDLADRVHDCDLLLDQTLGRAASDYKGLVPDHCICLVGPKYALLRTEFADMRAEALVGRLGRGFQNMLITMGGVDLQDATSRVLRALYGADLPASLRITVVMGAKAPALEQVRTLAQDMQRPTEVLVDVTDMATHMAIADLAIGAAGSTTWERCALGLPTLIVQIADNQASISHTLSAAGAALDPGPINAPEFTQSFRIALAKMDGNAQLTTVSQQAAEICDGDGTARVTRVLCSPDVRFRAAKRSDSRRIWEWRRAMDPSFNMKGENTLFERHHLWFCRALDSSEHIFQIMMIGDLACGYLRLDRSNDSSARVNICLSPDMRGQGLSPLLLEEASRLASRHRLTRLNAEIHPSNKASRRVFDRGGYVESGTINNFLKLYRTLEDAP